MSGRECFKIAYATKGDANIAKRSFRSKVSMDAYECPRCGSWHLTTRSRSNHPAARGEK